MPDCTDNPPLRDRLCISDPCCSLVMDNPEAHGRAMTTAVFESLSDNERALITAVSNYHHIAISELLWTAFAELHALYTDIPEYLR